MCFLSPPSVTAERNPSYFALRGTSGQTAAGGPVAATAAELSGSAEPELTSQ